MSARVDLIQHASIDGDQAGFIRAFKHPGSSAGQPVVRLFPLIAVLDLLTEQPILVENTVAVSRHSQRGEGVEKAGGETSQASVSERGVFFGLLYLLEI